MADLDIADRRAAGLAVALAGITGFTTVVGWLALAGVFFGPQSGNVIVASANVVDARWERVAAHGIPVVVFFVALVVGYLASERAGRRWAGWLVEVGVLGAEAALLATAGVVAVVFDDDDVGLAPHSLAGLVTSGLAIAAIGLQSSAVRPVLGERVNTIATTGLLIGTARDLAARIEHGAGAPEAVHAGQGGDDGGDGEQGTEAEGLLGHAGLLRRHGRGRWRGRAGPRLRCPVRRRRRRRRPGAGLVGPPAGRGRRPPAGAPTRLSGDAGRAPDPRGVGAGEPGPRMATPGGC